MPIQSNMKTKKQHRKFEQTPEENVQILKPFVEMVLVSLGWNQDEVLVTDESYVTDFVDVFNTKRAKTQIKKAEKNLGIVIQSQDLMWETAERLFDYACQTIKDRLVRNVK